MPLSKIPAVGVDATGTPSSSTFFRGDNTWAAPASITSGTAVTASGTSVDFTGIPSTAKRITVMFSGVSGSGTSNTLVQLYAGTLVTSGYISTSTWGNATVSSSTAGFIILADSAAYIYSGQMVLTNISGNSWVESHQGKNSTGALAAGGGDVSLSGTLTGIRITKVNGTDTFDAGTINIMWE